MPTKKDKAGIRQAEWARHSRDEEQAIRQQQARAGPSHEPVLDAGAATVERQLCEALARRWLDPRVFLAVTGPLSDEAAAAVQTVVRALADELRGMPDVRDHPVRARALVSS